MYIIDCNSNNCFFQIRAIDRKQEVPHDGPMCDLLWSDPEGISLLQIINHVINLVLRSLVDNKGNVLLDH